MTDVFASVILGPTEKLIMLALADHADDSGRCYPSIEHLCAKTSLSERAMQSNIRGLTERGFIAIQRGGGRGRANEYIVTANPAAETPFQKPRFKNTVSDALNPASPALNPAAAAPQPSITIIEPSKVNNISTRKAAKPKEDQECIAILSAWTSTEAAEGFVQYRRKSRHKALTARAATSLAKKLAELFNMGINPDDALATAEERGWATIEIEWITRGGQHDNRKSTSNSTAPRSPCSSRNNEPAGLVGAAMRRLAQNDLDLDGRG